MSIDVIALLYSKIMHNLLTWNIYEITTNKTEIHGVMLRGRLRKLGLEQKINVLCENATDVENCVRFAILDTKDAQIFIDYLKNIISDVEVSIVRENIANPVLSKLKVNKAERYTI